MIKSEEDKEGVNVEIDKKMEEEEIVELPNLKE